MIVIEELESDCLQIRLDIIIVTNNDELRETVNAKDNAQEIIDNVTEIIEEFGYIELEPGYPSNSGSLYFTFCDADKYDSEEVELIIGMRVSDHKLPKWNNETEQDAKDRQLNFLRNATRDYYILNKHLDNSEIIPVDYIYVKYENEYYSDIEEVYAKIRQKLREFQNKHK